MCFSMKDISNFYFALLQILYIQGLTPNISVCISFEINDLPYIINENNVIVYYDAQVPMVLYFLVIFLI